MNRKLRKDAEAVIRAVAERFGKEMASGERLFTIIASDGEGDITVGSSASPMQGAEGIAKMALSHFAAMASAALAMAPREMVRDAFDSIYAEEDGGAEDMRLSAILGPKCASCEERETCDKRKFVEELNGKFSAEGEGTKVDGEKFEPAAFAEAPDCVKEALKDIMAKKPEGDAPKPEGEATDEGKG